MAGSKVLYLLAYVAAVSVGVDARVCGAQDCPQRDVRGGNLVDAELYRGNVLCPYVVASCLSRAKELTRSLATPAVLPSGAMIMPVRTTCVFF